MTGTADSGHTVLLAAAALIVALQAWRGWRLGVVRQTLSVVALGAAYLAAILGGRLLVPWLRPLGFPDPILAVGGGCLLGAIVFIVISALAAILFKKTSDQSVMLVRLGYGAFGAVIGALFGLFIVWVGVLAIRVLGTVAETEVTAAGRRPAEVRQRSATQPVAQPPGAMARSLAQMKSAIEHGASGAIVEQVDPLPAKLYSVLAKLGQMISSEQSVERFLAHPDVRFLSQHPRIVALQHDPTITRGIEARDYLGLIRNERIVQAANDPEIAGLMRGFEFEKALDHALEPQRETR